MPEERSPLHRKHREPFFWHYACAYIMIPSGILIWLVELFLDESPGTTGVGLISVLMGLWLLSIAENQQLRKRIAELEERVGVSPEE